jgi:predicted PurR-regulated permease PerM
MSEMSGSSPKWSSTTKLVVALVLGALLIIFFFKFQYLLGPVLIAFILAYIYQPIAQAMHTRLKLPWRWAVTILYLLTVAVVLALLVWGGFAIVGQVQSLIHLVQDAINGLPAFISQLTSKPLVIGSAQFDLSNLDLTTFTTQILNAVQLLLSNLGNFVTTIASGTVVLVGWTLFSLLVSYFILAETGGSRGRLVTINIPGYTEDLKRIGRELGNIWNAFLRGQSVVLLTTILVYNVFFGGMGVSYFYVLSLLAALARLIPYVGPLVAWITYGLVAYFQGTTVLGLSSTAYAIIIVVAAYIIDNTIDMVLSPRLMAYALRLHPAAVMITALIALNLLGLVGLILAAPALATFILLINYAISKILDVDPWTNFKTVSSIKMLPLLGQQLFEWFIQLWKRLLEFIGKIIRRLHSTKRPDSKID